MISSPTNLRQAEPEFDGPLILMSGNCGGALGRGSLEMLMNNSPQAAIRMGVYLAGVGLDRRHIPSFPLDVPASTSTFVSSHV